MTIDFNSIGTWVTIATALLTIYNTVVMFFTNKLVQRLERDKKFSELISGKVEKILDDKKVQPWQIKDAVNMVLSDEVNKGDFDLKDPIFSRYIKSIGGKLNLAKIVYYLNHKQLVSDSHLSRMNAWHLHKSGEYLWSIGWAVRSLKRLALVKEQQFAIDGSFIYSDMVDELFDLIVSSIESINSLISRKEIETVKGFFHRKNSLSRVSIRAFKDVSDFFDKTECEYLLQQKHRIARTLVYNFVNLVFIAEVIEKEDIDSVRNSIKALSWYREEESSLIRSMRTAEQAFSERQSSVSTGQMIDEAVSELKRVTSKFRSSEREI